MTDTLVFATGASRDDDALPDWSRHALPGTTLVFYMGVRNGPAICANLLATGLPADTAVKVVAEVSTAQDGRVETTLGRLIADIAALDNDGAAVIFLTIPKTANDGHFAHLGLMRQSPVWPLPRLDREMHIQLDGGHRSPLHHILGDFDQRIG